MFSPATNTLNNNDFDWVYDPSIMNYQPPQEPLQEPVPFEDFKFSFGLDPDFSVPFLPELPLTTMMIPSTTTTAASSSPAVGSSSSSLQPPLPLSQPPSDFWSFFENNNSTNNNNNNNNNDTTMNTMSNTNVLDENDKKEFSNFLDSFSVDPQQQEEEERRRNSILKSLDDQKRKFLNGAAKSANATDELSSPSSSSIQLLQNPSSFYDKKNSYNHINKNNKRPSVDYNNNTDDGDVLSYQQTPRKRSKSTRELLTEEEKRANHIASEQKRRSTIRNGFKDLTDLIPTLKNINNSKSTVLFKAVDFIRHLEKRNKGLHDKIASLEARVQDARRFSSSSNSSVVSNTSNISTNNNNNSSSISSSSSLSSSGSEAVSPVTDILPSQQESQEQRLLKLQEQLQFHQQRLLTQHMHTF